MILRFDIIINGHQEPITIRDSWSEQEKNAHTSNPKAMNIFYGALNKT